MSLLEAKEGRSWGVIECGEPGQTTAIHGNYKLLDYLRFVQVRINQESSYSITY